MIDFCKDFWLIFGLFCSNVFIYLVHFRLAITLSKLIEQADKERLAGDEEKSYVLYMKFMSIMSKLQKSSAFSKEQQKSVSIMFGGKNGINKIFDKLVTLKLSLQNRYAQTYPTVVAEPMRMNIDHDPALSFTKTEVREVIDCKTLYDLMKKSQKLLIMDCRSEEDYEQSKMNYKYTMNVPEKILKLGMTASKIKESLPNDSKVFWELRLQRQLIFVDWCSKIFNRNSPVWHLKEILLEWDQEHDKKPEILLLSGGYDEWKTVYPTQCINPQFSPPISSNGDVPAIGDIEYPNIDDIEMKDKSLNKTTPLIDRSIKPNASKLIDMNKTQLQLLEETEKIMDKSLRNEKELLNLETGLKEIVSDKENNEDSSAQEQQMLFKIWELQSKEKDFQVEEKNVKEMVNQANDKVEGPQEMTKLMQVEQHLKEMADERKHIQEQRELKKKEREEALKFARDRKPQLNDHRTPPKSQRKNEIILSPKELELTNQTGASVIPAFDRSSKPIQIVSRQIFNEEDFSPVYGRVVS